MEQVRAMTLDDREAVRALWRARFGDAEPFMDWFFANRFRPETSACVAVDGAVVCAAQGLLLPLSLRGKTFRGLMISGVSTAQGYEKRGYMHRVMALMMQLGRKHGCAAAFYKPAHLPTFFSIGHLPCTDTLRYTVKAGAAQPVFTEDWDVSALLECYLAAMKPYSGYAARTLADMALKLDDYRSDGARLITLNREGRIGGYAVVFPRGSGWYGEEALAVDGPGYRHLLSSLPSGTEVKLPPEPGLPGTRSPQNVMGLMDAPGLIGALIARPELTIEVHDPVVPQNEGVFDGCGSRVRRAPDLVLTAGELMQRLCGYLPLEGVLEREVCYCVDEY